MLQKLVRGLCWAGLLAAVPLAIAQEFSADAVNLNPERKGGLSKIYVGKDKLRLEMQSDPKGPAALIFDVAHNTRIMLMPAQHIYMDLGQENMIPMAFSFFRPPDANDACAEWKKTAEQYKTRDKWGTCTKIGPDTVNGRSAIKYQGTSSDGKTNYVWVDTKLSYVVKAQGDNGGIELRNIQEGTQPASLFEVPSDYTKFEMGGGMMKRPQ